MSPKTANEDPNRCERLPLATWTRRRLWSESGGYCQNPECGEFLFPDDREVDFAEMAHIIAATSSGARDAPKAVMSEEQRAHHGNLAVLCANCHTRVDKDTEHYPIQIMREWKARHQTKLKEVLGTPEFDTRAKARAAIETLMGENRTVFDTYGPDDHFSDERAQRWHYHAVRSIVPNNATIARILKANRRLLTGEELRVAAEFDLHQVEFAARHVLDDFSAGALRFPEDMNKILKESI